MRKRLFTGVLVLLAFMAGQSYACPILKAIIGSSDVRPAKPTWVYAGGEAAFVGCQSVGSIVNCTWSGANVIKYETHVYPNDHVICRFGGVGQCTVTLTVIDSQGRTDTDTCTVYVVSIGIRTDESTYVAVNNDDDNENGIMDMCEDGTVDNEDTQPYDLRKILLSVNTPKLDDKVKLVACPDGGEPRIQVWSYRNKGSRIIPRSVPNEPDKYYVEWPSGSVPSELYVEAASYASAPGNHPYVALGYIGVNRNTTPPTEELVYGDPPAPINFTFLEVDVDIDGVKDNYYTDWKFTDETIPGGFIPLNGLVKINLMSLAPSDLPINAALPVTLKALYGGDKIRIWDNENKTGSPITLPKKYESRWSNPIPLWVEGIGLSSIPRDITLALEYAGFEDRIRVTVFDLESVCLSSGNAIESPVCFEGGKFELGNPCASTGAEKSLIIPHCNVRSLGDPSVIRDFVVGADTFFAPALELPEFPQDIQDTDKWLKVAGPASGYFDDIKMLHAKYRNPKNGGVYELKFELPGYDNTRTKALLHLPLAGPHAESWVHDQAIQLGLVAGVIGGMDLIDATICYMATSASLDWNWEADQSGLSPCHVFGTNETITIHGVVVSDPKFQNFMWGYYCRCFYPGENWWVQVLLAGLIGTPDTSECWEAYMAGKEWCDGDSLATVMERRGFAMQVSGELEEKLWPSTDPYIGGREGPPFFGMSESELISYCCTLLGL